MQLSSEMEQAQMALQTQVHGDCSDVRSQGQYLYRAAAPRSMASPNWRGPQPSADLSNWLPANQCNFALAANSLANQTSLNTNTHSGGLTGYAYCLDRGNGHYTRLIPADMLPPLRDIPAHQPGPAGMVILPELQRPPPQGVPETNKPVAIKTPPRTTGQTSDMLQKKIDHIVATNPISPKKPKIYCDKWIHEGVCAFAQQGCRFKHEMPYDKELQVTLGLYQGFPPWWRKYQGELQRQQELKNALEFTTSRRSFESLADRAGLEQLGPASLSQQAWRKGRGARIQHAHAPHAPQEYGMNDRSDALRALSFSSGSSAQNVWGPIEPPKQENFSEPALFGPRRNAWAPCRGGSNGSSPASEDF